MADRHNYYFGELVTEDELDDGFAWLEEADWNQNRDAGLRGLMIPFYETAGGVAFTPESWTVKQNTIPDFNVLITTGYAADKLGRRIAVDPPTTVLVDCSVDYLGAATAVVNPGNENWLGIYLKYARVLSDPRIDDNGLTVYFDEVESYELEVRQGGEQVIGTDAKPGLDSEAILIGEVYLTFGTAAITTAIIYSSYYLSPGGMGRTELIVRTDVENLLTIVFGGVPSWWPFPAGWIMGARNMNELGYVLLLVMARTLYYGYATRDGGQDWEGDFTPDLACTHDLGKSGAEWRKLYVQSLQEYIDQTLGGRAEVVLDLDWLQSGSMGQNIVKRVRSATGLFFPQWMNALGRTERRYMHVRQDFMYSSTHGGPFDYRTQLTATGAVLNNPVSYAQILPNGFVELQAPAAADAAEVFNDAYPLLPDRNPSNEFGFMLPSALLSGGEVIYMGVKDALVGAFAYVCYDPFGALPNPGIPNANWWLWLWDGVIAPPGVFMDLGVGPNFDTLETIAVNFERDPVMIGGRLWLRIYRNTSLLQEVDLTTPGYEPSMITGAYDYTFVLSDGVGGMKAYLDYVDQKAELEF
jgi:hypothetical protein